MPGRVIKNSVSIVRAGGPCRRSNQQLAVITAWRHSSGSAWRCWPCWGPRPPGSGAAGLAAAGSAASAAPPAAGASSPAGGAGAGPAAPPTAAATPATGATRQRRSGGTGYHCSYGSRYSGGWGSSGRNYYSGGYGRSSSFGGFGWGLGSGVSFRVFKERCQTWHKKSNFDGFQMYICSCCWATVWADPGSDMATATGGRDMDTGLAAIGTPDKTTGTQQGNVRADKVAVQELAIRKSLHCVNLSASFVKHLLYRASWGLSCQTGPERTQIL